MPPPPEPCPENATCVNRTCPAGLVRLSCGPCPLSCSHVSTGTPCPPGLNPVLPAPPATQRYPNRRGCLN